MDYSRNIEILKSSLMVNAFSSPYCQYHDGHQEYYIESISQYLKKIGGAVTTRYSTRFPNILKGLWKARIAFTILLHGIQFPILLTDKIASVLESPPNTPSNIFSALVNQFILEDSSGTKIKFCIDAMDSPNICSSELLKWCDVYFKSNYWAGRKYIAKVQSVINANPKILRYIPKLIRYRKIKKDTDICFIQNVRGGFKTGEGIEHNLRMLEQVSKIDCKKYLLAVLVEGNLKSIIKRLDNKKIPWTTSPIPVHKLWEISSRSKINILRLGMHYCTPWRTMDMLAMGACMVLDHRPFSVWPVPLKKEKNYLDFELDIGPDKPLAYPEQYDAIPDIIKKWLSNNDLITNISERNGKYFDNHASPGVVGEYIIKNLRS